jgi:hypothetical protein
MVIQKRERRVENCLKFQEFTMTQPGAHRNEDRHAQRAEFSLGNVVQLATKLEASET